MIKGLSYSGQKDQHNAQWVFLSSELCTIKYILTHIKIKPMDYQFNTLILATTDKNESMNYFQL